MAEVATVPSEVAPAQQSPTATEEDLLRVLGYHINRSVPGSGLSRALGKMLPEWLRPGVRVVTTNAITPFQRMKAARMARTQSPLQLNLGCGMIPLKGWVNVDLIGLPVDLAWNIQKPLPFPDDSVDAIFHEHVMEHISAYDGYRFTKDCYRVLKPGGVLRIVMPDASRYISSYVDPKHEFLESWRPGFPTPMMALQHEFYGFSHRAMYDYETLALFGRTIGFTTVEPKKFGESRITPAPDCEWRIPDSFYTEMVK